MLRANFEVVDRGHENFKGISFWNGFDFNIVNDLQAKGLLELSTTRKTLTMTKKGMK